jgi:hypothetical protein
MPFKQHAGGKIMGTDKDQAIPIIIGCLKRAGIDETELDDLILDIAAHEAATAANLAENEQTQEDVIDVQFLDASAINNGGMQAQVATLIDYYGLEEATLVLQGAFEQERLEIRIPGAHSPTV